MKEYTAQEKEQLLKYVFDRVNLGNLRYKLIDSDKDLLDLKKEFYVSPNHSGVNCLLVFMKTTDKHYSFLVERKTLNYNWSQVDIKSVKMYPVRIRFRPDVYRGTIFDGVLNNGKEKRFTICDTYYFRGSNFIEQDVMTKSLNVSAYVAANYVDDENLGDIKIKVSRFYSLEHTKELIETLTPDTRGLAFYPQTSGLKYLLININYDNKEKEKPKDATIYKELKDNTEAVFKLKKTDTIDVYNLYLLSIIKKGGKKLLQNKKIGIAYVPTIECSDMCRSSLKNRDNALMYCRYIKEKDKWMPVKECNDKKKPNLMGDIFELK